MRIIEKQNEKHDDYLEIHLDKIELEMIDNYCSVHGIAFEQFFEDAINEKLSPFMEELEKESKKECQL